MIVEQVMQQIIYNGNARSSDQAFMFVRTPVPKTYQVD